ncbi:MAG: hypothetical protein ACTHK1_14635 [Actinomycetales bacterium]
MSSSHALTPPPRPARLRRVAPPPAAPPTPAAADIDGDGSATTTLHPNAHRLLQLCWDLGRRAAIAAAHDHVDAIGLLHQRLTVEEALRDRYPETADLLDDLAAWEADVVHIGDGPAQNCLICRRIQLDLPDLPLPGRNGSAR